MANTNDANIIISAADVWAHAMEAMAGAEKNQQSTGDEVGLFQAAKTVLYAAVMQWRRANPHFRN